MNNTQLNPPTITRKSFQSAGLTLSYLDNQLISDLPPVVMLHGFTASAKINWLDSDWMNRLTHSGRRAIAIDARGHGESEKPYNSDYYPSNVMMQDSIELLNQLDIPMADYVGFSMGARMAAFTAMNHPSRVRKLLIGGMGINLLKGASNPQTIADALLAEDIKTINSRRARRFRLLAEKTGNDLTALAHCILSARYAITRNDLANITAKTLILVGDDDDTAGNPFELEPYIDNSIAIEIEHCTHFNALTNETFRDTGLQFIQSEKL